MAICPEDSHVGNAVPRIKVLGKLKLSESHYKLCLRVELVVLCVLIAVIWALLAIPLFIFYLAEIDEDQAINMSTLHVSAGTERTASNISNTTCPTQCSKDFYCKSTHEGLQICAPTCNWKETSDMYSDTIDILGMLILSIGLIVWLLVMVTGCIRWKRVFIFPSVLIIIYQNITWLVLCMTVLISLTNRNALFCVSGDLIESVISSSGFCAVSGIIFYYGALQIQCWWICHVVILFWKIAFSIQARSLNQSKRIRHMIHATCVLYSLLVPLLPVLVTIGHDVVTNGEEGVGTVGFTIIRLPPVICSGVSAEATFYSLVLPSILILDVGVALLILLFWFVHKQTVFISLSDPLKFGKAEKKLLVVIIYLVVLAVVTLATYTTFSRVTPLFIKQRFEYFDCEQHGPSPSESCDKINSGLQDLKNPVPASISYVLLALLPWLSLIFTVNINELKEFYRSCMHNTKHVLQHSTKQVTVSEG